MPDILIQADALVLLASGITIKADVLQSSDGRDVTTFVMRDTDFIPVRPSNWAGADWSAIR